MFRPSSLSSPSILAGALAASLLSFQANALDLVQSYQLALQNDANYKAAQAQAAASREAMPKALALLLPNISAGGIWNKNQTEQQTAQTTQDYSYRGTNTAVTLRQPLYRKYNFALYDQAEFQVNSAEATLAKELRDLLVRVTSAYFEALLARDQLLTILAQKEATARQLLSARKGFAAGTGTRADIDEAQARLDMVEAQELQSRQNVDFTRHQLSVIINEPAEGLLPLNSERMTLDRPDPDRLEDWIRKGEENNPELSTLRADVEVARKEVEKNQAGHYPTVDFYAQRSRSSSEFAYTQSNTYTTNTVGLQLNVPLFSGGYVNASIREALANLERTEQRQEAARRSVGLQIRKEFQNVTEGIARIRALERAVQSAGTSLLSTRKGFQAGTRTQLDILNAQQLEANAHRDLAQARYQYLLARVRLQGLAGILGEAELLRINGWLVSDAAATGNPQNQATP